MHEHANLKPFYDYKEPPAAFLKRKISSLGVSYSEIARRSGLNRMTIQKWGDHTNSPKLDSFSKLLGALEKLEAEKALSSNNL